jgi:aspartate kinase
MAGSILSGIDAKSQIAKVTLHGIYDRQGVAAQIFGSLGQQGFNVEAITTTQRGRKRADISFAVPEQDIPRLTRLLHSMKMRFGARNVSIDRNRALLVLYGAKGFAAPGAAGRIFAKFSELGINIEMISSSLSILTLVIPRDKAGAVTEALKQEFVAGP